MLSSPKIGRAYCRVSTKMQSRDGLSLQTQKEKIQAYCVYKNIQLVELYEDAGISGKSMDRPALQKLLADMTKAEYVIVCDLYRLGRNTMESLYMLNLFIDQGIYFVCLNPDMDFSTPFGELIYTFISALGRMERRNISMNVSANMQRISREGKLRSRCPFGWKFVGKEKDLQPIKEQQDTLCKILKLYDEGVKIAVIARKLNEDGDNKCLHLNKKEKDKQQIFYPETVKNILKNHRQVKSDKPVIPIEKRIISHHKATPDPSTTESNIVQSNGLGPIIENVPN
jgi:DNA invertase Pin-like site-specific DNA recombinase